MSSCAWVRAGLTCAVISTIVAVALADNPPPPAATTPAATPAAAPAAQSSEAALRAFNGCSVAAYRRCLRPGG